MTLVERIDTADICLLDKIVCCYQDAQGLVQKSLVSTKRAYGLTYRRVRWFMCLGGRPFVSRRSHTKAAGGPNAKFE